jgi:hypothetical protein
MTTVIGDGDLYYFKEGAWRAVGQFSPIDLDPLLWFDAADLTTITQSSGAVSQWNDKSGNARHATQTSAGLQPATGTRTINSLNVLDFNGDALFIPDESALRPSTFTSFLVVEADTTSERRDIFASGNALAFSSNNWIMGRSAEAQSFLGRTPSSVLTAGSFSGPTVLGWRHDGSTVNGTIGLAPSLNTSSTIGTDNTRGIGIGASRTTETGIAAAFDGAIAELVFYSGVLSAADRFRMFSYLYAKWVV